MIHNVSIVHCVHHDVDELCDDVGHTIIYHRNKDQYIIRAWAYPRLNFVPSRKSLDCNPGFIVCTDRRIGTIYPSQKPHQPRVRHIPPSKTHSFCNMNIPDLEKDL
eukprot:scaffold588739_cov98-Attheya_sp.AAC.1